MTESGFQVNGKPWGFQIGYLEGTEWLTDSYETVAHDELFYYYEPSFHLPNLMIFNNLRTDLIETLIYHGENSKREATVIYREQRINGVYQRMYRIDDRFHLDQYLYIYDKLVIISLMLQTVYIYSAQKGFLFSFHPKTKIIRFSEDLGAALTETKQKKIRKDMGKKITVTGETGISIKDLEFYLRDRAFIPFL